MMAESKSKKTNGQGDKATILARVKIGDGAIIGANSMVTKNVPAYSVVAGNPAKKITRTIWKK